MGNVVDYVRREFHGFAELPFGDVDSLVLAELSYMRLSGLVPAFGEARSVATVPIRELLRAESYDDMFVSNSSDINEYRLALLRAVCESPRFRALRVGEYAERLSEREQQQFAAMTFDVGCGPVDSLYVAFRGTDGTLVGWKEDFNMAGALPGAVPGIRVSVCELDSGQVGRFPFVGRFARGHARRAFERRQYGRVCGHAYRAR